MYNRYVPQADGTFRRSTVPEKVAEASENAPQNREPVPEQTPSIKAPEQPIKDHTPPNPHRSGHSMGGSRRPNFEPGKDPSGASLGTFFRQLFPRNFDTEDLIVVLLLLLISSDSRDDQNTALLTLVIYLFL